MYYFELFFVNWSGDGNFVVSVEVPTPFDTLQLNSLREVQ